MSPIVHDTYGLSKAERWLNCPGSVNRCRGVEEPASEAHTHRGTLLHNIAEALSRLEPSVVDAVEAHQVDPLADLRPAEMTDIEWDATLLQGCRLWRSAMSTIASLLLPGYIVSPEVPVDLSMLGIEKPGHIDLMAVGMSADMPNTTRVVVLDYKTGKVQVEARNNPQGAGYCVGAAEETVVDEAVFVIVQPFDDECESIVTRKWLLDQFILGDWRQILTDGKAKAEWSNMLVPGHWCTYCPARMVCEARRSILAQQIELPALHNALQDMTQTQRGEFYGRLTQALKWCEAAVDSTKDFLATTGLEAEGFKWKKGASIRIWNDPKAAEKEILPLLLQCGIPENVLIERKMKSPAVLEKEKCLELDVYAHLIGTKENAPSLAPVAKGKK